MNRKTCRGCIHLRKISYSNDSAPYVCHYLLDTDRPRPCGPENCTVKEEELNADEIIRLLREYENRKKRSTASYPYPVYCRGMKKKE